MKTLLELEKSYRKLQGELETTLEDFTVWLTGLPSKNNLELEYFKW